MSQARERPGDERAAAPGWDHAVIESKVRALIDHQARVAIEPFMRAMRRRLERDRNGVHPLHRSSVLPRSPTQKEIGQRPIGLLTVGCRRDHWYTDADVHYAGSLGITLAPAMLAGRIAWGEFRKMWSADDHCS